MKEKAVVFDFGGVLFKTSATDMYKDLFAKNGKSPEDAEFFLKNIFTKSARSAANTGTMAEVTKAVAKEHPEWAEYIHAFDADKNFIDQVRGTIPGMEDTLKDISAKGIKIYGLTNWAADTFPTLKKAFSSITKHFSDVVVSGEVGIKKPNPAIFQLAHKQFGLDGKEVYFFDDKPTNTAAAQQAAGWNGITFQDASTVRTALKL